MRNPCDVSDLKESQNKRDTKWGVSAMCFNRVIQLPNPDYSHFPGFTVMRTSENRKPGTEFLSNWRFQFCFEDWCYHLHKSETTDTWTLSTPQRIVAEVLGGSEIQLTFWEPPIPGFASLLNLRLHWIVISFTESLRPRYLTQWG